MSGCGCPCDAFAYLPIYVIQMLWTWISTCWKELLSLLFVIALGITIFRTFVMKGDSSINDFGDVDIKFSNETLFTRDL